MTLFEVNKVYMGLVIAKIFHEHTWAIVCKLLLSNAYSSAPEYHNVGKLVGQLSLRLATIASDKNQATRPLCDGCVRCFTNDVFSQHLSRNELAELRRRCSSTTTATTASRDSPTDGLFKHACGPIA